MFAFDEILKRDVALSKLRLADLNLESLEEIVKERRVVVKDEEIKQATVFLEKLR